METYHLNISHKEYGNLWQEKALTDTHGLILDICNVPQYTAKYPIKRISFTQVSLDKEGNYIAAGDQIGCIYIFDIERNRFWLVCQLYHCCSAITFTEISNKDILFAITDAKYSLYLFNSKIKKEISVMRNHKTSIIYISVDSKEQKCLSSSVDLAVLWDLKTYTALHHMSVNNKEICKAIYIPFRSEIIVAFKDGNLFLWESKTLEFQRQLYSTDDKDLNIEIKTIDVSSDGVLLVVGNHKDKLVLWNMNTKQIECAINISSFIYSFKQVIFMPVGIWKTSNYILGVVSQDGGLHMYNYNPVQHLLDIQLNDDRICNISTAENGNRLAAISGKGHILLFDFTTGICPTKNDLKIKKKYVRKEKLDHFCSELQSKKWEKFESNPKEMISVPKLCFLIKKFGACPEEYRFLIWLKLLQLPGNYDSFQMLIEKGEHPLCAKLCKQISCNSANDSVLRALQRLLSALIHWCPFFGDLTYIPMMIFPFVKLYHSNLLNCFEIIISIICNWYQNWFLYFPLLPISILSVIENLLAHHDKQLLQHFAKIGVSADLYAWTLLQNSFFKILPYKHWLQLWDHILANNLSFVLFVVVSFNINIRNVFLRCMKAEEIKSYFEQEANISAERIIKKAYFLLENTPSDLKPDFIIGHFTPLPKGAYPIFYKYPKDNNQRKDRERIFLEELDYLQRRKTGIGIDDILYEKWKNKITNIDIQNQNLKEFNILNDFQFEKRRRKFCIDELKNLEIRRRDMLKKIIFPSNNEEITIDKEKEMQRKYEEYKIKNLELLIQRKLLNEEFLFNLDTLSEPMKIKLMDWYQKHKYNESVDFVKRYYNIEDKILMIEKEGEFVKNQIHLMIEKLAEMKKLKENDDDMNLSNNLWKENFDESKGKTQKIYDEKMPINRALEIRRRIVNQEKLRLKEYKFVQN